MNEDDSEKRNSPTHSSKAGDLALLFTSDLRVGKVPLYQQKVGLKPFHVRYEIDGRDTERNFLSMFSWRAMMLFAHQEGRSIIVREMDRPGRLEKIFPPEIRRQLTENAAAERDVPPVLKLFDPNNGAIVIITRSRYHGHAIDALHNLTDGPPLFQPIWISDLLRLNVTFGIDLVRDQTFAATLPISAYLEAASITGSITEEPTLRSVRLTGNVPRFIPSTPSAIVQRIFDEQCRKNSSLEAMRYRSIYDDYFPQ